MRHSIKHANLDLTIDSRLKQGLFPHIGTIGGKNQAIFGIDGSELFVLGEEGGIRCLDSLSGSEKWRMMMEVGCWVLNLEIEPIHMHCHV